MRQTGIAVIESRWWQDRNTSVRGLFDLVADIACGNPHRYHYEMAGSKAAMKEAIPRIASYHHCKYLCIASHGDAGGIALHNDEVFSRTELRNALRTMKSGPNDRIHGVHLASCIFGSQEMAGFIFEQRLPLTWISGYQETIGWIDSSALDLLFFNQLIYNQNNFMASLNIKKTARKLLKIAPGLIKELGFGIYVRNPSGRGVINLLGAAYT